MKSKKINSNTMLLLITIALFFVMYMDQRDFPTCRPF